MLIDGANCTSIDLNRFNGAQKSNLRFWGQLLAEKGKWDSDAE